MAGETSINAIIHALEIVQRTRWLTAVGYIVFIYDWLLGLETEVRLIWPARFSLVKTLYFFVRFTTLIGLGGSVLIVSGFRPPLSDTACKIYSASTSILQVLSIAASNWLMMLRVCALYGAKKHIVYPLYGLFISSCIACLIVTSMSLKPLLRTLHYSHTIRICMTDSKDPRFLWIFGAPFFLEAVIFVMTAWKFIEHARMLEGRPQGKFIRVLTRDGLAYYAIMVCVRIWNMWSYANQEALWLLTAIYTLWSVTATLTMRILLNLRNVANPRDWNAEMEVANLDESTMPTTQSGTNHFATNSFIRSRRGSGRNSIDPRRPNVANPHAINVHIHREQYVGEPKRGRGFEMQPRPRASSKAPGGVTFLDGESDEDFQEVKTPHSTDKFMSTP